MRRAGLSPQATSWAEFWDRPNRIYVNDRHREVHYARLAEDVLGVLPQGRPRVLDYGCGEALHADRIAARCGHLHLCDGSRTVRERLASRCAADPAISVLAPEGIGALPDQTLDLVVASSVVQYVERDELRRLLPLWRRKLTTDGRLVIADVIEPGTGVAADVTALLELARREGFLLAALGGLAVTLASDYRRLRRDLGLSAFTEAEMLRLLAEAGFVGSRRQPNFGFDAKRMTFIARRA